MTPGATQSWCAARIDAYGVNDCDSGLRAIGEHRRGQRMRAVRDNARLATAHGRAVGSRAMVFGRGVRESEWIG